VRLVVDDMANGVSACTGLVSRDILLGTVGQSVGYQPE
jgi:hypothetical protein